MPTFYLTKPMLAIETRQLDRLIPYVRNARTHAAEQVAQIAGSIAEFGFVNPILIRPDDVIVAGHGRVLAAQRLGFAEVPVIVLAHLSEAQRRALVIADNRIAENAGWDEAMLRAELTALQEDAFDLDLLGFAADELGRLLDDMDVEAGAGVRPYPWFSTLTKVWSDGANYRLGHWIEGKIGNMRLPNHSRLFKALMTAHVPGWRTFELQRRDGLPKAAIDGRTTRMRHIRDQTGGRAASHFSDSRKLLR